MSCTPKDWLYQLFWPPAFWNRNPDSQGTNKLFLSQHGSTAFLSFQLSEESDNSTQIFIPKSLSISHALMWNTQHWFPLVIIGGSYTPAGKMGGSLQAHIARMRE